MVTAKRVLLQIKKVLVQAAKSYTSSLCKGPETLHRITVGLLVRKFVVAVLKTKMLLAATVYRDIAVTPAGRVKTLASSARPWMMP